MSRFAWSGRAVSQRPFVGVVLVSGVGKSPAPGEQPWLGGALVVLGLVSWALYTIGGRQTMNRFSPLTVNWTTLLLSVLFQVPLLWTDQKVIVEGIHTGLGHGLVGVSLFGGVCNGPGTASVALWGQAGGTCACRRLYQPHSGFGTRVVGSSARRSDRSQGTGRHCLILAGVWLVHRQSARRPAADS